MAINVINEVNDLLCKAAEKYVPLEKIKSVREAWKENYKGREDEINWVEDLEDDDELRALLSLQYTGRVTKEDLLETLLKEYEIKRERIWDVEPCTAIGLEHSGISHIVERMERRK